MLNKETENKLKVLGIDVSKLIEAAKADNEVSLEVPTLYTEEQKNKFGSNRFDEGKTAMSEILAKDVKKTFNIDIDSKDINEVVKTYGELKSKESGKPNERILALEKDNKELQDKLSGALGSVKTIESEYANKLFNIEIKNKLNSLIPETTTIPKDDVVTLFLNYYNIEKDVNGRTVLKKDNEILKDNVLNPLEISSVLNQFLDQKQLIKKDGMGGSDRKGGGSAKFSNMADFMDYCDKNKIEPMGKEGQAILAANKEVNFKYN